MNKLELLKEDLKSIYAKSYFNLLLTGGLIEEKVKKGLKAYGITHAQLNVLSILIQNSPEPMPVNALKEKMLVRNPDMTRLLDRLVKKGYVSRKVCPENRRRMDISITESGAELYYDAHFGTKTELNNYFQDRISEAEAKELRRILRKIRE